MSFLSVAGLRVALKEYESDKVRERAGGAERIREIFGNKENLVTFHDVGGQQGGAGWVALFQCLFQGVSVEKRGMKRGNASATTEKRLAEAISLVRWMAERAVHLISRRPLIALVTHMTALLVHQHGIFEPAVRDYAKALRTLLVYPPHLESLDEPLWKRLMSVIWAGALGDNISQDDQWQDESYDQLEGQDDDGDEDMAGTKDKEDKPSMERCLSSAAGGGGRGKGVTQIQSELLLLFPILLSSPSAPLLPAFPTKDSPRSPPTSLGSMLILKIVRFLDLHPAETSAHLSVMRGCNIVLAEMELNSRQEFVDAGTRLLPHLQGLWLARSKPLREQVIIAFKRLHPFITHYCVAQATRDMVLEQYARVVEGLRKEVCLRWGIAPLDMGTLLCDRSGSRTDQKHDDIFTICGIRPGYDFTHEHAYSWSVLETYAKCYSHLIMSTPPSASSTNGTATGTERKVKRARTENHLATLLRSVSAGSTISRLLAVQTLCFVVQQAGSELSSGNQADIADKTAELLDADDENIQCWAYLLAGIAVTSGIISSTLAGRVWGSCMRRLTIANTCRPAAYCAIAILDAKIVSADVTTVSIGDFLRHIDVQGPSYLFDTVATFIAAALDIARSDVRLYSLNLDEKVLAWIGRFNLLDGTRGRSRMEPHRIQELSTLLSGVAGLSSLPSRETSTIDWLPECPVVEYAISEHQTAGIRRFILDGTLPSAGTRVQDKESSAARHSSGSDSIQHTSFFSPTATAFPSTALNGSTDEVAMPSDRQIRIGAWLTHQLEQEITALASDQPNHSTSGAANPGGHRPVERVRKGLDVALLGAYYLGMLRNAHIKSDSGLSQATRKLLEAVRVELSGIGRSVAAQYLLWSGLTPLLPTRTKGEEEWPVLLRSNERSGTRPDMALVYKDEDEASGEAQLEWLRGLWTLPELSESLKSLVQAAREVGGSGPISADPTQAPTSTQAPTLLDEDDDFGEIRDAEADAMPLAKEGSGGQRLNAALQQLQIQIRLFGAGMQGGKGAVKDTALLNTLLSLEGARYLQTAELVADAVQQGLLRLTPNAIEHIFEQLTSGALSYAYSRDERMLLICLSFLRCSAPLWLADGADTEINERAMELAFWIVRKRDLLLSWRVHLALLRFIDEYLDYEPESHLWIQHMQTQQQSETDEHGNDKLAIPAIVARALVHRDIRVRIRGATSTAGLWYLPTMATTQHQQFYLEVMNQQPRMPTYWNAFLTDLLWKLNCLVASAAPRAAVLFHLLEIPYTTGVFDLHLERGLIAVAERIGLPSLASMFDTYAPLVVNFLLSSEQSPLAIRSTLCGYPDDKSRAEALLAKLTPQLLQQERYGFLQQLCEQAGQVVSTYCLTSTYPIAARLLCAAVQAGHNSDAKIMAEVVNGLDAMPFSGKIATKNMVTDHAAQIAVEVLRLVSYHHTPTSLAQAMSSINEADAALFLELADCAPPSDPSHPDFSFTACEETEYLQVLAFLQKISSKNTGGSRKLREGDVPQHSSQDAIAFNAFLQLFADLNASVLLGERARLVKGIALAIGCFPSSLRDPRVLQLVMQEVVSILDQADIGAFAMHLLDSAMAGLISCNGIVPRLDECLIRLGRVYPRLSSHMRAELDEQVSKWGNMWRAVREKSTVWYTVEACSILWPPDMQRALGEQGGMSFESVAELAKLAEPGDAMILCDRLAHALRDGSSKDAVTGRQVFSQDLFWHIKQSFDPALWTMDGAKAFIELLTLVEGQVQIVCTPQNKGGNDDRLWDKVVVAKVKHDANLLVQVLAIRHLAKLSCGEDQWTRYAAYSVLRQLRAYLNPVIDGGLMPKSARAELPVLLSPYPPGVETSGSVSMSDLQRDNLAQYASDADAWLCKTAVSLSRIAVDCSAEIAPFYASLAPALCGKADSVAPFIPILTQAILAGSKDTKVLDMRRKALKHLYEKSLRPPTVHPMVVESILSVVLRLRAFTPPFNPKDALGSLSWLDWDYLLLAEAASKAGSYATALLCLEIAIADLRSGESDLQSNRVQEILLQIYTNVDDPDGFYGIKTKDVGRNLRRRLDHEGEHMRAFGLHGADLEVNQGGAHRRADLLASARHLHAFGLNRAAQTIARVVQNQAGRTAEHTEDLFYDIAWRTGEWDLPVPDAGHPSSSGSFYSALRAVHRERDSSTAKLRIEDAIKVEMMRLKDLGSERKSEMNRSIDHLICLGDAHHWYDQTVQQSLSNGNIGNDVLRNYVDIPAGARYPLAERQHATRVSILSAAQARENDNFLGDLSSPLSDTLASMQINSRLRFCTFARDEGNAQAAINAITAVQHLEGANPSAKAIDEFGAVLWMQGEHTLALQQVNEMLEELEASSGLSEDESRRLGVLLGRQAHWSHLSRQLTSHDVVDKYSKAVNLLNKHKASDDEIAQLNFDFACFAADEQQNLRTNGELDTLREYRTRKQIALDMHSASAKDNRRSSRSLDESRGEREQSLERENEKVVEHEKAIDNLTVHALRSFAQAFRRSDKFDESMTRMCSIWLAHADSKTVSDDNERRRADGIAQAFASYISYIPSHKFIFLGPQLAARLHMSAQQRPFDLQLNAVMLRLAQEHPFHILYQIVPLAADQAPLAEIGRGKKSTQRIDLSEGRGPAAAWLLQQLDADQVHTTARQASRQIKSFARLVHDSCWLEPPGKSEVNNKPVKVDSRMAVSRLPSDMQIPVATVIPAVRVDRNYSEVPRLVRYGSSYDVLGGVHRPKKMRCYDTLGQVHYQLFKSDDEIRQDAIMEQVFGMTNNILKRDRQTKARRLNFRTYVVIPLANRSGILEFVAEGISIGDWLKPAHDRYRKPDEQKNSTIRETMYQMQGKRPEAELVRQWKLETTRFHPVMRHFFREKQPEPMAWFTMRTNYARSVAVTSMVGHMLGIGDRHLSNIMIDQVNGELIHIDFGIVFEEGLNLRIPERVPFRLTRDMIDGLGIMGVDGTFRRCSEQTLRVLRASSPLIMTVLEVFKHDPLFAWMGDPSKLERAQGGGKLAVDPQAMAQDKADRVLGKIRAKLKDELGVEYTVNQLVLQATDPVNLGTIYFGWHSWF